MENNKYTRWQFNNLKSALKYRRVLVIAGARQCGKTTLAKRLSHNKSIFRTLDDATTRQVALEDPHGFVNHDNTLMVIDEIQRAPDLLPAIKLDVDNNTLPGRFLLTGSANIHAIPSVIESLAGRMRKVRLRPLACGEIYNKQPQFIPHAFQSKFNPCNTQEDKPYQKDDYIKYALEGGYPEARKLKNKERKHWHLDYIHALIERDLKDIINIKRQDSMLKLVQVLAAWSSCFMNMESICKSPGLSITRATLETYLNALETLYIIDRVPSFTNSEYDRINKHDKLFMTDTGLMASILNWNFGNTHLDGKKYGHLLETFVYTQLAAILDAQDDDYTLYHYRDADKKEIDFIIESPDGALLGIEVKAGSAFKKDAFKHLKWFKERIAKDRPFTGIILYSGPNVLPFGPGFWAVPMSCMWG